MNVLRETIQQNHFLTFCVGIASHFFSVKSGEGIDQILAVDSILNIFPSYMLPNCIIFRSIQKNDFESFAFHFLLLNARFSYLAGLSYLQV